MESTSNHSITTGRFVRNVRARLSYPLWVLKGKPGPDNHFHKTERIKNLGRAYQCSTFIETGTFYGQTVAAVKSDFKKTFSVELSEAFYNGNVKAFSGSPTIKIFHGDSANRLGQMIDESEGRILFWLDGHFSGGNTACGEQVTPIMKELTIIREKGRKDDCLLIDDARLFTGKDGYPATEPVFKEILKINPRYKITVEHDCIVALVSSEKP